MKTINDDATSSDGDSFLVVIGVSRHVALIVGGAVVACVFALLVWRQAQQTSEHARAAASQAHERAPEPPDPDEAERIKLVHADTLDLPEGFTVEAAGSRSTTLRLRGWTCKPDFFEQIRASVTGHLARTSGFTTLECISETKTITEPL